jgi:hypothetical protein
MINNNQQKQKSALDLPLEYSLASGSGKEEKKSGTAQITEENILLKPELGEPMQISYREIIQISEADYKITFDLVSKEKLIISGLGYQYEDFLGQVSGFRNEMLLKDLLMKEAVKKSGIEAEFSYSGKGIEAGGNAELRLYDTALVVIPKAGDFIRIPYSGFSETKEEDYKIVILTDSGNTLMLSKMGDQFDPFKKILSDKINELSLESQEFFKGILPNADTLLIRKAARLMQEGEAVSIKEIKALSPELSSALEKKMEDFGIKEEYDYLKSMADEEEIALGFKKGLMGALSGDYLWFLIPITKPGNVIAMESTTEKGSGKSTYFFRLVSRKGYNGAELRKEAGTLINTINKAMIEINFRREPIYLPDEKLEEPEYAKYRFAVEKMPALKTLRSMFIGRVSHSSPEQWKKDVGDLLKFNVSETDDNKKWEKEEDKK